MEGYSLQIVAGKYVPTVGISQEDGLALIAQINAGQKVVAKLNTQLKTTTTYVTEAILLPLN